VRLICPRRIGAETKNPLDGFNVLANNPILTVHGKQTTVSYDTLSQLPLLYTIPGIKTYQHYMANICQAPTDPIQTHQQQPNLSKLQRHKLYLYEACAHEGFTNLNRWIKEGRFPHVDKSLALEPDPQCSICNFGKARRRSHKSHVGHISAEHKAPGAGVSSDGMEAGTPGRVFTTKGLASTKRYKYVSFWIDHFSSLVYATFHETKHAKELVQPKLEFEQWAACFGVRI
jgi:hypothetical protein